MPRRCFAVDLDPALAAEYVARHAPGAVWPEVLAHLRSQGVQRMEIWRTSDRLFMLADVSPDFPRPGPTPAAVERWEAEMWRYQRPLPQAAPGEKWVELERVFLLEEGKA